MVKHNTPGLPDGGQAFWIDGELRGHWAGIDWRKTAGLQANALTVETYVTERRPQPESVAAASLFRVARYRSERSYLLPLTVVEQWQHDMVQTAKLQTDDLAVKGAKALDSDRMALADLTTHHRLVHGDSRDMSLVADESVHLVVTSPPYWTLKTYNNHPNQLGHIEDYESFLDELDRVWRECFRVLTPGGRLVCVVGDVCLSRRKHGRHWVMPLHADITVRCRRLGFDNLNPIIWLKISNAAFEANTSSKFLGKPYEPNAIVKNDMEFILMQRKPGGYRQPTDRQRELSRLPKAEFREWCQQTWTLTGASTRQHPAPFPLDLAQRLVRMFSFAGDTVLDPFAGTGTTMLAALQWARNSVGFEVDPDYFRILNAESAMLSRISINGSLSRSWINPLHPSLRAS